MGQEDASALAWSGIGEAVGSAGQLGRFHPAALASEPSTMLMVSVIPSIYGIGPLRRAGTGFQLSGSRWGAMISAGALDAGSARRAQARLSLGGTLTEALSVGVAAGVARWSFQGYSPILEGEASAGCQFHSAGVTTGALVTCVAQSGRPVRSDELQFAFGASVRPGDGIRISVEAVGSHDMELRAGARIEAVESLALIVSWSDTIGSVGGGIDVTTGALQWVVGTRWHPLLGWTHGGDLRFAWR